MSSFWWGQSAFDELVGKNFKQKVFLKSFLTAEIEKATSELLPAGQVDLALHLEISDQIRSKKINAKEALRSFKQRLSHKNPNVIIATLSVSDIKKSIKNNVTHTFMCS